MKSWSDHYIVRMRRRIVELGLCHKISNLKRIGDDG